MTIINQKSISGITSITFASAGDDLLTFHSNNGTERFRIDNSGNTKITAGIVTTLTVTGNSTLSSNKSQFDSTGTLYLNSGGSVGSGNYYTKIASDGSADFLSNISIADKIIHYGDTDTAIRFPAADTVTVETAGNERIRVTSDGKVGINTDMGGAPASLYPFSVYRSTGTGYVYTETAQSGASAGLRAKAGTADFTIFTTQGTGQLAIYDNTNSAERLRITSGGDVGIGDAAPNSNYGTNLSVHSTATDGARLKISDGTTGKGNTDGLDIISTGGVAYILNRENAAMSFSTNDTERLRIDSSGRVLAGTTSTYDGEASNFVVATSGHTGITVASTGSGKRTNLYFADGTSGTAAYAGGFTYDHNNNTLLVRTASSEIARFTTTGLTFNGDTSSANALDDYEEGTFTPGLKGASTAGSPTIAAASGAYTKIGRSVTCLIYVSMTNKGGMDGIITIKDLPFTIADTLSSTGVDGGGIVQYYSSLADTSITRLTLLADHNSTDANIYYSKTGQSMDGLDDSDINDSWNFRAVMHYYTAT